MDSGCKMDFADVTRRFAKETPGADTVFQPSDIGEYTKDEWDIRISIGDQPLDEAFYFTMADPGATRLSIEELLDSHALNPSLRSQLDVAEYPDLPFMQEELIQFRANERAGLMKLEYFINHNSVGGSVNLRLRAEEFLSVCTYHDGSHDYRVLDIVMVPTTPETDGYELERVRRSYSEELLLILLDYHIEQGPEAFAKFLKTPPAAACLSPWPDASLRHFTDAMKELETKALITRTIAADDFGRATEGDSTLQLTDAGKEAVEALKQDFSKTADYYDQFDSVATAPPALGVPGGFDARVQMMEFDGADCERAVLLQVLGRNRELYFGLDVWVEAFNTFSAWRIVCDAMAYKTNFSAEILQALKDLAG